MISGAAGGSPCGCNVISSPMAINSCKTILPFLEFLKLVQRMPDHFDFATGDRDPRGAFARLRDYFHWYYPEVLSTAIMG